MGYNKDREEFFGLFARLVPGGTNADALAFLRDASAEQRWNEISCSFDIGEKETARLEKRSDRRVIRVCERAKRLGLEVDSNGDPRGNPFCLLVGPNKVRLSIPARGLPASAFR